MSARNTSDRNLHLVQRQRLKDLKMQVGPVAKAIKCQERYLFKYFAGEPSLCPLKVRSISDCVDTQIRLKEKAMGLPYSRPKVERFKPQDYEPQE